ncbi:hypothetical protein TNCV_4222161 [Trichonephila clavipes]|nr:hypothetical protein TNCV_4222161 [Trichonephila clavipes]
MSKVKAAANILNTFFRRENRVAKFDRQITKENSRQHWNHRTWGCRLRLVVENSYNSSRRENDEPNKGSGESNCRESEHPDRVEETCTHLVTLVCETLLVRVDDLTAWTVVASADICSTPDLFGRVRSSFLCRYRLSYELHGHSFERFLRQSLVVAFPDIEL